MVSKLQLLKTWCAHIGSQCSPKHLQPTLFLEYVTSVVFTCTLFTYSTFHCCVHGTPPGSTANSHHTILWEGHKLGKRLEHKLLFLLVVSHRDAPAKTPGHPAKQFVFLAVQNVWPPPLRMEDPHPTEKYQDLKVEFVLLFGRFLTGLV